MLTAMQQMFSDEYLIDFNATQAAKRAGYSPRTACSQGSRLLRNVEVQKYIAARIGERESELVAKSDEVLRFLTAVMRGELERVTATAYGEVIHVDQRNQLKAAELLAKYYGLLRQGATLRKNVTITFVDDLGDDE